MLQPAIARGELVELLADDAAAGPPMSALCAPGRHRTPRVRAFVAFASELLGGAAGAPPRG